MRACVCVCVCVNGGSNAFSKVLCIVTLCLLQCQKRPTTVSKETYYHKCARAVTYEHLTRRARREMEAAIEEAERLKGQLAGFKHSYEQVQKELQVITALPRA